MLVLLLVCFLKINLDTKIVFCTLHLERKQKHLYFFMTFTTYYEGKAVLFSNTPFDKAEILKQLISSELGEISIGYYRFILIEC